MPHDENSYANPKRKSASELGSHQWQMQLAPADFQLGPEESQMVFEGPSESSGGKMRWQSSSAGNKRMLMHLQQVEILLASSAANAVEASYENQSE